MLHNKHVIAALIITPLLSILAYFATDSLVGEQPKAAQKGNAYELIAKPNCRYASGVCGFKNGDFEISLRVLNTDANKPLLELKSVHGLQGVRIAISDAEENQDPQTITTTQAPVQMLSLDSAQQLWQTQLTQPLNKSAKILLAISANDTLYYAQTNMEFLNYETSFDKDFRQNRAPQSITVIQGNVAQENAGGNTQEKIKRS